MKRQRKRRANETASAIASPQPGKQAKPPEGGVAKAPSSRVWPWLLGFLLLVSTFVAYLPALRGGFVWDDDSWTLRLSGLFQSASGLRWIWFQPTELQQYYPLTATTFWLDYQLWKFWTLPYHVENILLHVLAALLFWRLLVRLQLPGAWLAAALFALHPVMVESAAWITERKNVLSLSLYLASLLAYERFAPWVTDDRRTEARAGARAAVPESAGHLRHAAFYYGLALLLFLGALLAKTTAFSLPAVILLTGLVAARTNPLAGGRVADPAILRPGARPVCPDGLAGKKPRGRPRAGFCPDLPATLPDCRPGLLVLPRQIVLAGQAVFCLPALAAQSRSVVAMALSGDGGGDHPGALAGAETNRARADNGAVVFCGHIVSGAGIYERVFHAFLVCL